MLGPRRRRDDRFRARDKFEYSHRDRRQGRPAVVLKRSRVEAPSPSRNLAGRGHEPQGRCRREATARQTGQSAQEKRPTRFCFVAMLVDPVDFRTDRQMKPSRRFASACFRRRFALRAGSGYAFGGLFMAYSHPHLEVSASSDFRGDRLPDLVRFPANHDTVAAKGFVVLFERRRASAAGLQRLA